MSQILDLLKTAEGEVGYLEKASNYNLDDTTGNAGYNNWTKYARDLDNLKDFYNGPKNGYAWCDVFVDWCFVKTFGKEKAMHLLCQPKYSAGAGCQDSANYYKQQGRFYKNNPQPGDQIFFVYGNSTGHTGIVYAVDSSRVYTIEGNTSGANGVIPNGGGIFKKSYALNGGNIYGYGRPRWESGESIVTQPITTIPSTPAVTTVVPAVTTKAKATTSPVTKRMVNVQLEMLREGSVGQTVKSLQQLLIAKSFSVGIDGADGDFGANTTLAVKAFQSKNRLEVDGIVGTDTWTKILAG